MIGKLSNCAHFRTTVFGFVITCPFFLGDDVFYDAVQDLGEEGAKRMSEVEKRMGEVERRVSEVEERVGKLEKVDVRIGRLESDVKGLLAVSDDQVESGLDYRFRMEQCTGDIGRCSDAVGKLQNGLSTFAGSVGPELSTLRGRCGELDKKVVEEEQKRDKMKVDVDESARKDRRAWREKFEKMRQENDVLKRRLDRLERKKEEEEEERRKKEEEERRKKEEEERRKKGEEERRKKEEEEWGKEDEKKKEEEERRKSRKEEWKRRRDEEEREEKKK